MKKKTTKKMTYGQKSANSPNKGYNRKMAMKMTTKKGK